MKYGVVLMRAQPVHKGHIDVIENILEENTKALVIIGSANKFGTKRNPLPIAMREQLVKDAVSDYGLTPRVEVMTLPDWSTEDAYQYAKEWGNFFYYNVVARLMTKEFTIYYNNDPNIVKNWFTDEIAKRVTIKNSQRVRDVSGTKIREALKNNNDAYLKEMLCPSTYDARNVIAKVINESDEEDYMMM